VSRSGPGWFWCLVAPCSAKEAGEVLGWEGEDRGVGAELGVADLEAGRGRASMQSPLPELALRVLLR
jgi:hypothetical protein